MDENVAGASLTAVATENATSTTVDDDRFEVAGGNLKLKDGMSLDFEGDDGGSVDVTITASGDGESATHTVTVTINDVNEPSSIDVRDNEVVPVKDVNTSLTIDENTVHDGKDGAPLALIEVTDPDAADATTGDAGAANVSLSGDMADYFQVILDPEQGLWLALKDGVTFDYETVGDSVMVTVTYTDQDGATVSADVTVTVNDVNEAPEVAEGAEVADAVFEGGEENSITVDLKALFSDPDGDVLTYRLDNAPDWLEMSVTVKGSGADQTIMGTITGTGPDRDGTMEGVMIVASDTEHEGSVSFDVIVDAENDAPSRLELRVTEDDGFVVRTTEVSVDENDQGAVLGLLKVTDEDDPRHPHGQHEYSFMVDGKATDKFEVDMDGNLKLKDDKYLNHEDGDEITLTVTATDMHVTEPGEGEDHTTGSVSLEITINVGDVASADRPVANRDIDDWWVTVDDDLDAEDVHEGEWLSFGLDTTGDDAAFSHEDGDDLTYSVSVVDSDGNVVNWLQIDEDGKMTNKEEMLPERGVYTVTVTATDEDGDSAQTNFQLAVALSDANDRDNDTPDIRDVEEIDYTEGSGSQMVATFSVRDDDVAIAPHPYGVLKVELDDVSKFHFKVMEVGRDSDSVHYAIYTRSDEELAVHPDTGKKLARPTDPLDHDTADEADITVTVTDGAGEEDDKDLTIDIDDAADEAPEFQGLGDVDGDSRNPRTKTTTVKVAQDDTDKEVIVVRLSEAWEDEDTDDDDLKYDVDGDADLPDWITVYGPDEWERIYDRRDEVDESDGGSTRDGDEVVVIVIDRKASDTGKFSFQLEAEDREGHTATETIVIEVDAEDVPIASGDAGKVVSINGDPSGTAPLTMSVNLGLDPNLDSADDATLVVYTWRSDNATPDDDTDDVTMVSSTPQPLAIFNAQATPPAAIYPVGTTFHATVQYYEMDPDTGAIIESAEYMAQTKDPTEAPGTREAPTSVSFDVTTGTGGVTVQVTATGDAASSTGSVRLQASSNDGQSWVNVGTSAAADTSGTDGTSTAATLTVNEDGDGTNGDGGGLHYRVSYSYTHNGQTYTRHSEEVQLGDVEDPVSGATTNIIGGSTGTDVQVGRNLRVDTQGNDADVQWQSRDSATAPWKDIAGANSLTLRVTSDYTGKDLRAKVTYTADDDPATTNVDEEGWVEWVEYTEILDVAAVDVTNNAPERTEASHEIRVELAPANMDGSQPSKVVTEDVSGLFFDPDGQDLTYSITGAPTPDLNAVDNVAASLLEGGSVYRSYGDADNDGEVEDGDMIQQVFTIDENTGEVTYLTGLSHTHDGTDTDGGGNTLTFTLQASDGQADSSTSNPTVVVRINVAPTDISFTGSGDITNTAGNLSKMNTTDTPATVLTIADGDDDDSDPDAYTIAEHVEDQAAVTLGTINVMDQNQPADDFGDFTDRITFSDNRFEVVAEEPDDGDASTWVLRIKEDAVFDYEKDGDKKGTLVVTVTATDGGGLKTVGYFSIQIEDNDDDPAAPVTPPPSTDPYNPEGLEDDAKDDDDDGPVIPPDDGGAFIDDLLDQFVISIEDIDIA